MMEERTRALSFSCKLFAQKERSYIQTGAPEFKLEHKKRKTGKTKKPKKTLECSLSYIFPINPVSFLEGLSYQALIGLFPSFSMSKFTTRLLEGYPAAWSVLLLRLG